MFLFKNIPEKINQQLLFSEVGIDKDRLPYTLESILRTYASFPKFYFSGWQQAPESTPLREFLTGRNPLVSSNYEAHLNDTSYECAITSSIHLQAKLGIPFRVWIASFVSKKGLTRPLHYDWYDGILINFSGRKIVTMYLPVHVDVSEIFRYQADVRAMEQPTSEGIKFTLDAGEALYIPAFAHHYVENVSAADTAALSIALDTSTLLIDIFRLTLEQATQELRYSYQPRSMGGARLYGTEENWRIWKESIALGQENHWIYQKIQQALVTDVPASKSILTDSSVQHLLRTEWVKFVRQQQLNIGQYLNP